MRSAIIVFMAISVFFPNIVLAADALDFADTCSKQGVQFKDSSAAIRESVDESINDWDALSSPPPAIRPLYVQALREAFYKAWKEQSALLLKQIKDSTPAFDEQLFFNDKVYPVAMSHDTEEHYVRAIFKSDYAASIRPKLLKQRDDAEETIKKQQAEMDKECKPDLVSQTIRATSGNTTIILKADADAAKNENGDFAKAVRSISGISLADIEKYGIRGGENSAFNSVLNAAGNSDVKNLITKIIDAFDSTKWSLPTIQAPTIRPPIDRPPTIQVPPIQAPPIQAPTIRPPTIRPPIAQPPIIQVPHIQVPIIQVPQLPPLPSCCRFQ